MVGLPTMNGKLVEEKKVSEELLFRTQQGTKDIPSYELFVHAEAKRSVGTSGPLKVSCVLPPTLIPCQIYSGG